MYIYRFNGLIIGRKYSPATKRIGTLLQDKMELGLTQKREDIYIERRIDCGKLALNR